PPPIRPTGTFPRLREKENHKNQSINLKIHGDKSVCEELRSAAIYFFKIDIQKKHFQPRDCNTRS
ncbi:MAG: hypothetical protein K0U37_05625, partial [Gammaproteobacteria bacterium]|nr:hypothetical protein [Gammaproteobacteria bacterium]